MFAAFATRGAYVHPQTLTQLIVVITTAPLQTSYPLEQESVISINYHQTTSENGPHKSLIIQNNHEKCTYIKHKSSMIKGLFVTKR